MILSGKKNKVHTFPIVYDDILDAAGLGFVITRAIADEIVLEGDMGVQPDFPRCVYILLAATIGTVDGTVTITGPDADGRIQSESKTFSGVGLLGETKNTVKAFSRITKIEMSGSAGAGTYTIGVIDIYGLPNYQEWRLNASLFKIKVNQADVAVSNYTLDLVNGTVDIGGFHPTVDHDTITFFIRPLY